MRIDSCLGYITMLNDSMYEIQDSLYIRWLGVLPESNVSICFNAYF